MDPNAALADMRALVRTIQHTDNDQERHDAGRDLADRVEGLDSWLRLGGFLPADWQAGIP